MGESNEKITEINRSVGYLLSKFIDRKMISWFRVLVFYWKSLPRGFSRAGVHSLKTIAARIPIRSGF